MTNHIDTHTDTPPIPPVSIHIDHQDTQPASTHTDTPHLDFHTDSHGDEHGDLGTPVPLHGEIPPPRLEHEDLHADTPGTAHGDVHNDV